MAGKEEQQCKRISEITDKLIDKSVKLYDDGKLDQFLDSLVGLDILLDVEVKICAIEKS